MWTDRHVIQDNLLSWVAFGDEFAVHIELKWNICAIFDLERSSGGDRVVIGFCEDICRAG
jgi:hypothetical protein